MGFCSAFGMFLGHYMAWICSGILCAAFVQSELASGVVSPNPTPANIAMLGAGYAGIVCVLLAGWTTANPTLYRAGLMIVTACIPDVLAYLDRIVAYYGLFFIPLGAFVFIDFWLFPMLGLERHFAEQRKLSWSWPAAVGWFGSFGICFVLYAKDNYESLAWLNDKLPPLLAKYQADLFSQVLPAWVIAVVLYTIGSFFQQKLSSPPLSLEAQR